MAESTENGILEYLESISAPENAETFTEVQTGLGREGFRKFIPDPTQVADFLNFPKKEGLRTLAPAEREEKFVGDLVSRFTDMFEIPFGEEVAKRSSSQSLEDRMEAEVARAELFKGQEMSATGDRSALDNFKGGGLEALLLDKYPDLADNPAFKTARFLAPQTLGEAAFEAATLFPPLFWMKPLKAGSRSYKEAQRLQDRIEKLQNTVKRENINSMSKNDGNVASLAATRAQNEIVELRDNILEIVRKEDPAYADRLEDEARKKYIQAKRDADPMEKVRRRMEDERRMEEKTRQRVLIPPLTQSKQKQGIETLVDQKSTLKKEPESELMPKGFKTGDEILEDYNKNFDSIIDQVLIPPLTQSKRKQSINTDEMSILEILEKMKDMDLD